MLGQIFEDNAQFLVGEDLHGALGRGGIVGQDLGNLLVAQAEVLGHLAHAILHFNTHIRIATSCSSELVPMGKPGRECLRFPIGTNVL